MLTKDFILTKILIIIVVICLTQFFSKNCFAVEPDEILQDQKLELRARDISKNIRCMICQNQSIDESNAPLARDLRILIRNKIKEGNNNEEIYIFLTDRYGDFILLKPPLKLSTLALWFLPFIFFIVGIFIVFWHNKKSKKILKDI
jgi:cytochrome c-type biogenesis protein CcmH